MLQIITIEMADQERSDFYVVFLRFAISNHAALKLHVQALRSFPRLIINISFISYQIEKLLLQRIIGQNYMNNRPPLARHFLRNGLSHLM